ncbi:MAG TPA: DUF1294 domain-containing protein [Planctomycetota bacterium]|nr:DUF1294 domain-containing protein [Planctomycetota bacterium]
MLQLLWALLALLNIVTLLLYGYDKWQSRREGRRVPERTLLWFLFAGGWIGAWLAMAWFRHKTVKASFRRYAFLWTLFNPSWLLVWWTWKSTGS